MPAKKRSKANARKSVAKRASTLRTTNRPQSATGKAGAGARATRPGGERIVYADALHEALARRLGRL